MGSDIEALTWEKSDECGEEGSSLWRRWPKQQRKATVEIMPAANPEKNPTSVAAGVNCGQCAWGAALFVVAELGGVAVALAELEAEEVVADADELELVGFCEEVEDEEEAKVEEVDDEVEDVLMLHWPLLSQ